MVSARQAHELAGSGESTTGWLLDRREREELLARFPPAYAEVVADHVTLSSKVSDDAPLPDERSGEIIGRCDDDRGVEAMVVRLGGTTDRPDGSTYHITWSLGPGREAKESNDAIAQLGWQPIYPAVSLTLRPERLK